ncbi:SDR family oxidoreductase [Hoeflea ulvae]|uniref:SDR family oxidoreductase n=1 Tax=Hoeflea ulvae TaxID=2983764 RepID=A0ABT3YF84_9HYPH|nr:SDR family oxidoreductase [Hoeflea ulvae]MCY0094534.1 SDR family oxidoreductase [Hoeflea ulvae]
MRLEGKTIIITGASSGIGAAAAELFAAEGANLVLGARRDTELALIAGKIGETGRKAKWLAGDISDGTYHKALVDLATAEFGGLDGAFNNAGTTGEMGPIPDMSPETWEMVIATNLTGGFHAARHQIPAMKQRGGSIVFTSSFVGHTIGLPGMGAYAASKAGLIGLVQVLAAEHGADGIRANALLPGGTRTAMAGDDPAFHDWVKGLHALKRMAEPEEIARAALFLVSDESSFVTGSALLADGGNSINKT